MDHPTMVLFLENIQHNVASVIYIATPSFSVFHQLT